jgi:hypothetical protein
MDGTGCRILAVDKLPRWSIVMQCIEYMFLQKRHKSNGFVFTLKRVPAPL